MYHQTGGQLLHGYTHLVSSLYMLSKVFGARTFQLSERYVRAGGENQDKY